MSVLNMLEVEVPGELGFPLVNTTLAFEPSLFLSCVAWRLYSFTFCFNERKSEGNRFKLLFLSHKEYFTEIENSIVFYMFDYSS